MLTQERGERVREERKGAERAEGAEGGREEEGGGGGGWKSANENENPHTEVVGKRKDFE